MLNHFITSYKWGFTICLPNNLEQLKSDPQQEHNISSHWLSGEYVCRIIWLQVVNVELQSLH